MLSVNISDVTIITFKNVDYRCIIHNISISEAINLLEHSVLADRNCVLVLLSSLLKISFLLCIKWLIVNIEWTSINL